MTVTRRIRTVAVGATVVAAMVGAIGPAVSQEEVPLPDLISTGGCDPGTNQLVVSWEFSNLTDVEMEILGLSAVVLQGSTSATVVPVFDASGSFPTELAPGESVAVGPFTFPGDLWWLTRVGYSVLTELDDEPVPVAVPDIGPSSPCLPPPPPPPPPEPIAIEPSFTG